MSLGAAAEGLVCKTIDFDEEERLERRLKREQQNVQVFDRVAHEAATSTRKLPCRL
jgi:hypothetical protein